MLQSRRAYSATFWIAFFSFCLVPMFMLGLGFGRYFYARAEAFKSADGAALAASQEVDIPLYVRTGQVVLLPSAHSRAQEYAAFNSSYLVARKIYPRVTDIRVDQAQHKVLVRVEVDVSPLFPGFLSGLTLSGEGEAQVRLQNC